MIAVIDISLQVYSLHKLLRLLLLVCSLSIACPVIAQQISLSIGSIESPQFSAKNVNAQLQVSDLALRANIAELHVLGKSYHNAGFTCPKLQTANGAIHCSRGSLLGAVSFPFTFNYDPEKKSLLFDVMPAVGESWKAELNLNDNAKKAQITLTNAQVKRVSGWLPAALPKFTQGVINGQAVLNGVSGKQNANLDLRLENVYFADAAGLHAGEKLSGTVKVNAQQTDQNWKWQSGLSWLSGEMFWQPLYFPRGGHTLVAQGKWNASALEIEQGTLKLDKLGQTQFSGLWDITGNSLRDFDLHGQGLQLSEVYGLLLKPLLDKTSFTGLRWGGTGDLEWRYRNGQSQTFRLVLHDTSIEDKKFAIRGLNIDVPWNRSAATNAQLSFKSAAYEKISFGETRIPIQLQGMQFGISNAAIPVLDGKFNIKDFHASRAGDDWQWQLTGSLTPISMEALTKALDLPQMLGSFSAVIPKISYQASTVDVDGALLFKVFDGTMVVKDLRINDPLGRSPRLNGNLDVSNLDLDLLTRTFSFGNIQGRIDAHVANLEMISWKPVNFDAFIENSPGKYQKKISQKAVQNISALGGAGAAAAIQRSFLGFFKEFSYDKIGLSCKLRNNVCQMDGVESTPQGYVIVKGGGIPAITVIGYNRYVGWAELIDRLKRVTEDNVKPIIK